MTKGELYGSFLALLTWVIRAAIFHLWEVLRPLSFDDTNDLIRGTISGNLRVQKAMNLGVLQV